jgi:hypothetical protein
LNQTGLGFRESRIARGRHLLPGRERRVEPIFPKVRAPAAAIVLGAGAMRR